MRSGAFRHKVTIIVPTSERGVDGSIENVDSVLGTFYASIATENAGEADEGGKLVTTVQHTILVRYNSVDLQSIKNNSKITINGSSRELHITSSHVQDYRNRVIVITAEERL